MHEVRVVNLHQMSYRFNMYIYECNMFISAESRLFDVNLNCNCLRISCVSGWRFRIQMMSLTLTTKSTHTHITDDRIMRIRSQHTCNQWLQLMPNRHPSADGWIHVVKKIGINISRIEVGDFARVNYGATP